MLELGYGFAFMGNQYRIQAQGREYFIDLLFYNRRMQCLVALEIKRGRFEPEYAGKMNFYLNLLDVLFASHMRIPRLALYSAQNETALKWYMQYAASRILSVSQNSGLPNPCQRNCWINYLIQNGSKKNSGAILFQRNWRKLHEKTILPITNAFAPLG